MCFYGGCVFKDMSVIYAGVVRFFIEFIYLFFDLIGFGFVGSELRCRLDNNLGFLFGIFYCE